MVDKAHAGCPAEPTAAPEPPAHPTDRRLIVGGVLTVAIAVLLVAGADRSTDTARLTDADAVATSEGEVPGEGTTPAILTRSTFVPSAANAPRVAVGPTTTVPVAPTASSSSTPEAPPVVPAAATPLEDEPAVVARPVPVDPPPPPPDAPPAPWSDTVTTTSSGHVSTDVGCVADRSAGALDEFFADRVGPAVGWDYQHVYPLGGGRALWLFQDTFLDHSNTATSLDRASFAHNTALVQDGNCFRLLHGGTTDRPTPFEPGTGTQTLATWFWPMGGELHDGRLYVFWARMRKDALDPQPPDGLGWHPDATFVATYDPSTLERLDFRDATDAGASPIYGYAMQSQGEWTYLFANTFEQNLARDGGWANGPHSGTKMFLGRVPRGQVFDRPEYWTPLGWTGDRDGAVPILQRHWAEFPFQPRLIDGQWVASTAVNGYWGDELELDVANNPWGPWTTVEHRPLRPRGADPKMNTYHAHLMPWRDGAGRMLVAVSNNARDMLRDAWSNPYRYRPEVFASPWVVAPREPSTTNPTTSTTTTSTTTTTAKPLPRPTTTPRPRPTSTTTSSTTSSTTTTTTTTTTVEPSTSASASTSVAESSSSRTPAE